MKPVINAIFLDVGNTLRIVLPDTEFQENAIRNLMEMTETSEPREQFLAKLEERFKNYRKQAKVDLLEASEKELWTIHMLPDYPAEKIGPLAGKLTRAWRDHDGRRVPRSDVTQVVHELKRTRIYPRHHCQYDHRNRNPRLDGRRPPDRLFLHSHPLLQNGHS